MSTYIIESIETRRFGPEDIGGLYDYLQKLGVESKRRFSPHSFDQQSIADFYQKPDEHLGYLAFDHTTREIIAYAIVKIGFFEHDRFRLEGYGLRLDSTTDCIYAPSVADKWQSCGLGNAMFQQIKSDLSARGIRRIILWGGVQSDNKRAIRFYLKNGFKTLGTFEYQGLNEDMILEIG
ncbi:MAG: GNAT family N-acetyltransferase [Parachlamydiaceae bacterium]